MCDGLYVWGNCSEMCAGTVVRCVGGTVVRCVGELW